MAVCIYDYAIQVDSLLAKVQVQVPTMSSLYSYAAALSCLAYQASL